MKILFYSAKKYDIEYFKKTNSSHTLSFMECSLDIETTELSKGYDAVCIFVNDICNKDVLDKIYSNGVRHILLRCAGFNNVDVDHAKNIGISVSRVPAYSPYSVAEHALALLLCLNRKIHKSYNRVREGNFNIEGLEGFDIYKKNIGIIGFGNIGQAFANIMSGFGGDIMVYDPYVNNNDEYGHVRFVELDEIFEKADVISLHCPLNETTKYIINNESFAKMKNSTIIINTSRGALIKSDDMIKALKSRDIAGLAIDVYEYENDLFFKDLSSEIINDDIFERLVTFPNVLITAHQGFLTSEALENISQITLDSATALENNQLEKANLV